MLTDFLCDVFRENAEQEALIWHGKSFSYSWLLENFAAWRARLQEEAVPKYSVVSVEADFSPSVVGLLLALIEHGCVVVPLTTSVESKKPEFRVIAQVEVRIVFDENDEAIVESLSTYVDHPMLVTLKERGHPGLVLFSSGSTGDSKAALHDFVPLLEKFKVRRNAFRTITFLLFDHIGGINTLLYNLSNAGCIVTIQDRKPEAVCAAIEKYRVELLPTSPTFINLLLVSEVYCKHDLSSLQLVTYGTEVMAESTLQRFHAAFPDIRLLQTYGLSEIGIMRSKSKSSDSLWVKIGGEGFDTRVVGGMLEIRAKSAMLGYLNAESPFTEDGWFKTGDKVEVDGEYMKILGRESEIINVGGEKVYPAEIEGVLQTMEGVEDVAVSGEANPISGQIIKARVNLRSGETLAEFRKRMRSFCKKRLARYKIPQKVLIVEGNLHGERFKKMRRESN
jgi:acyl-coenzyme A synthetase/AMP-(fatty) acid ligase